MTTFNKFFWNSGINREREEKMSVALEYFLIDIQLIKEKNPFLFQSLELLFTYHKVQLVQMNEFVKYSKIKWSNGRSSNREFHM